MKDETRSQRGNHALRSALFLSAPAAPAAPKRRTCYHRKRAAGKRHNAALISLSGRRTDIIYAMIRDSQPCRATAQAPEPLRGLSAPQRYIARSGVDLPLRWERTH